MARRARDRSGFSDASPGFGAEAGSLPGLGPTAADAPPEKDGTAKDQPHYHGHRTRLRERFLAGGGEGLPDYELLELLLFRAIPRRDVKPLAKALITRFGGFAEVISADLPRLLEVPGLGEAVATELKIVQAAAVRLARAQVLNRPVIGSGKQLLDYCTAAMAYETREQFRILFLDRKNVLIADEMQGRGTIDQTAVYPREVAKRALELGAASIILVHNHPSGDPTPSSADIAMTRRIAEAAQAIGVTVHDHLVIGKGRHASFKADGML